MTANENIVSFGMISPFRVKKQLVFVHNSQKNRGDFSVLTFEKVLKKKRRCAIIIMLSSE